MFNQPLMRLQGVVVPAASDWTLGDVTVTFSLVMGGFAWGAVFSSYLDRMGPRLCSVIGGTCLGTGFSLASVAATAHSLPLLYASGLVWGVANGVAYVPPIANLMRWFPDRKGLASGAVVVGYGAGALVAAPLFERLLGAFRRAPERLGSVDDVVLTSEHGRLFAQGREVVVALADDAAAFGCDAGVFVVGTGSTGVADALLLLGAGYASLMSACALGYRAPPPGFEDAAVLGEHRADKADAAPVLSASAASRTPQFAILYFGFTCASAGAYALISSSKLLLATGFPGIPPALLTSFVAGTSAANLTGRLAYSHLSDALGKRRGDAFAGRRAAYSVMWGLAPLGSLGVAAAIELNAGRHWDGANLPACLFVASAFVIMSSFGGSAATRPAIVSDMFGAQHTSALSARQLSAVLPASFIGPLLVAWSGDRATESAARELAAMVPDAAFEHAFAAPRAELSELLAAKTVTLARLMELVPEGVRDPQPYVFNDAMLASAGLTLLALCVGFFSWCAHPRLLNALCFFWGGEKNSHSAAEQPIGR